jgi:inward rectifier potassium channel
MEALTGLLGFAMATGLIFAKFARPSARVMFSRNAIVAVRDGIPSLMFRMANERATQIVEAQLRLVLVRDEVTLEGERVRRFHDLKLSRDRTAVFALSWTAIHPITADSPLYGVTDASLAASHGAVVASLVGIDETFSQTVHARVSYAAEQVVWGAKFVDIMRRGPDGRVEVDYAHFHDLVEEQQEAPALAAASG